MTRGSCPTRSARSDLDALLASSGGDEAARLRLRQGFSFAERAMHGQLRRSGEPMINHSVRVAMTLATWSGPADVVLAALLHDVPDFGVEDLEIRGAFGCAVADLVSGVQQLDAVARRLVPVQHRDLPEAVRRIKVADRWDNSKTWDTVPVESARQKALETLGIYVEEARQLCPPSVSRELTRAATSTLAATQWPARHTAGSRPTELAARGSRAVSRLYRFSVTVLPPSLQGRYAEEWLSDLATQATSRDRLRHAAGLVYSACSLRHSSTATRRFD